jgi:nicotinamidase-related amidase
MPMPEKKDRKIALVVIDVQRKFTGGSITAKGNDEAIKTINQAVEEFHKNDRPVIFVHYDGPCECSVYDKNDGDEYLHGIRSDPRNITVHKHKMNSFIETKLAEVVKKCGCDSILLTGMVTQYCVIGTYFGAFEYDICPYMLIGGTIATEKKYDDAAYTICKTFDMDEVRLNLTSTKTPDFTEIRGSDHPCFESGN